MTTQTHIPLKEPHGFAGVALALVGAYVLRTSQIPSPDLVSALPLSLMAALIPIGMALAVLGVLVPGLSAVRVAVTQIPSSTAGKASFALHAGLYWLAFLVPMLPHQGWFADRRVLALASITLLAPVLWRVARALTPVGATLSAPR